jgi:hypothetical protein
MSNQGEIDRFLSKIEIEFTVKSIAGFGPSKKSRKPYGYLQFSRKVFDFSWKALNLHAMYLTVNSI